ncbi:MAG TPA: hypothetical protein DD473_20740 [Planctomycetaceae bacterium]|nr:hypothetical protein [Planctomycetaceae bacterium]
MSELFPFPLEVTFWNEMSDSERDFFSFESEYLPIPLAHADQICRLNNSSSKLVWKWLGAALPAHWPEAEAQFPNQLVFNLESHNWNSDEGMQAVRQWLHDRNIPYSESMFLMYEPGKVIQLPWKLFVKYWDALTWSVGACAIVMDHKCKWALCFHHEDVIIFGTHCS